ncbi:MAG: hypothetical protein AB1411_10315 [Nitrospirota bacterium]
MSSKIPDWIGESGGSSLGGGGKTVANLDRDVVPVVEEKNPWLAPLIKPTDNCGPMVIIAPLQAGPLGIRKLNVSTLGPGVYM